MKRRTFLKSLLGGIATAVSLPVIAKQAEPQTVGEPVITHLEGKVTPIWHDKHLNELYYRRTFDIVKPDGTKHIIACDYGNDDKTVTSIFKAGQLEAL